MPPPVPEMPPPVDHCSMYYYDQHMCEMMGCHFDDAAHLCVAAAPGVPETPPPVDHCSMYYYDKHMCETMGCHFDDVVHLCMAAAPGVPEMPTVAPPMGGNSSEEIPGGEMGGNFSEEKGGE